MSDDPVSPHSSHPDAAHADADPATRARVARGTGIVLVVVAVLLAVGAGRTIVGRMANAKVLDANVAEASAQYVKTTIAKTSDTGQTLALPGSLQGFQQAPIAARSAGYVKRWTKDIGSHVEKGELLVEIESPEVDQQLSQAEAARQQAAASLALARSTVERWEALRKKDVVSQQELDERRSGASQAAANLAAADANVQRLRQLQSFTRVTAPFAGVITRRNVDVGDLIDSGGKTLFVLTQMDPLRVYVNVPQSYAQLVKPGQKVVVTQAELRGQSFPGRSRAPPRRSMLRRGRCRSRSPCRTATARCCPAPTCRSSCRSRARRRWSFPPTCCSFAAKARAWRRSTTPAASTSSR